MMRLRAFAVVGASAAVVAVFGVGVGIASAAASPWGVGKAAGSLCTSHFSVCADPAGPVDGYYVGHDEPSIEFKSNRPGSGNNMTYEFTLPTEPTTQPNNTGNGGTTWDFELRPTFWFGLSMCDGQSAPEYTTTCKPDTDANNLVGSDPTKANYIDKHPGNAYMELQFYPPGYVEQFTGFGCTATQYCAAMTIDSFLQDDNTGVFNTSACNDYILGGAEPINWAYITTNGVSQAPANPLFSGTSTDPNFAAVDPGPNDLYMNPGDRILVNMHDTPAGFQVDLTDLTTGQTGSMTASIANGFGHILYRPNSSTCQEAPYAFHPAYSTANTRGAVWTAHTYNVAYSDELGHFENCVTINMSTFNCAVPGFYDQSSGLDEDDGNNFCVPGSFSTLVMINGCYSADYDFDSQSYQLDWPGTNPNQTVDRRLHPTPVQFSSPLTDGHNYTTVAFETDLPAIEAQGAQDNPPFCNQTTGANCVDPPDGAPFYPFFTTTDISGQCNWQEGGNYLPNTVDHFGGSSTTEYGRVLHVLYPNVNMTTFTQIDDFNSGDLSNSCER